MPAPAIEQPAGLPDGVRLVTMASHEDHRGSFTEVFRREWNTGIEPLQWNLVHSQPRVLRGVHVHGRHADYLMVIAGSMTLALHDIRPSAATYRLSTTVRLSPSPLQAVMIPPGVCHGFWFHEASTHLYAVSNYWDLADELGCHWASPELAFDWDVSDPLLSDRDRDGGDYAEMVAAWHALQPQPQGGTG